ncbi:MAG: DUF3987 domain-containing protein [Chlorobiaceae bacterium]|nr:DUF3987 domain-containing protein [Chlorobiaceae bacterium]
MSTSETPNEGALLSSNDFLSNPEIPEEAIPLELFAWVISYYQTMSDAPKAFLFSSVLMTMVAAIGNKVHCQIGRQRVKPNLYMLLLAGSTVSRKSTAVSFTVHCLRELERRRGLNLIMPDSGSLEGMIEAMREPQGNETKQVMNSGIACYSELATFLDNMKKEFNKDFQSFVIDVYDGNRYKRQLKKEFSVIDNPCLSIFGGITMAQFGKKISEDDKHSGFLQRFLFVAVPEKTSEPKSLIEIQPPSVEEEERLINMIDAVINVAEVISDAEMGFQLSSEAKLAYQKSFEQEHAFLDALHLSEPNLAGLLTSYQGRLDVVKFKIAMIYETVKIAVEEEEWNENRLFITGETMTQAIAATTYYLRVIAYLIKQNFQMNPYAQKLPKAVRILRENRGWLNARELQKRMGKLPAGYFQKLLEAGQDIGLLSVHDEKSSSGQEMKIVKLL